MFASVACGSPRLIAKKNDPASQASELDAVDRHVDRGQGIGWWWCRHRVAVGPEVVDLKPTFERAG
jgi:hypothetical protein